MLGGAKPPRPSDTPPMLGGAKAALPFFAVEGSRKRIAEQPPYIPPNRRDIFIFYPEQEFLIYTTNP